MKAITTKKGVDKSAVDKIDDNVNPDELPNNQVVTPKPEEEITIDPPEEPENPEEPETPENPETLEEPETPPTNEPGTFDYKKKFQESSREAQVLASKNKKITETIEEASTLPEPTDEELKKEYPDWDSLTDFEQKLAKDNLHSKKQFNLLHSVVQATKAVDEWSNKVDTFIDDPKTLLKYKDLDGQEAEFRSFSMKESRRGLDFEDLVAAFLYNVDNSTPIKHKGSLLAVSNGGGDKKPKPQGYSLEQVETIRKTNSRLYKRLVQEGKIKIAV